MSYRIEKMGRGFTADLTEQKQSGQPVSQNLNYITPADALRVFLVRVLLLEELRSIER